MSGMNGRGGYESGDRNVEDLTPPPDAPAPGGADLRSFSFTGSMSVQADVSRENLALLMGETTDQAMSLTVETVEYVSGEPKRPPRIKRAWWGRRRRLDRAIQAAWAAEYEAWVAAGRPDIPVTVRRHMPRVQAHVDEDRWSFKVMPPSMDPDAKREDTE